MCAESLAAEVAAWLDGVKRREQALAAVSHAEAMQPEVEDLRRRAGEARVEAEAMLVMRPTMRPPLIIKLHSSGSAPLKPSGQRTPTKVRSISRSA